VNVRLVEISDIVDHHCFFQYNLVTNIT